MLLLQVSSMAPPPFLLSYLFNGNWNRLSFILQLSTMLYQYRLKTGLALLAAKFYVIFSLVCLKKLSSARGAVNGNIM